MNQQFSQSVSFKRYLNILLGIKLFPSGLKYSCVSWRRVSVRTIDQQYKPAIGGTKLSGFLSQQHWLSIPYGYPQNRKFFSGRLRKITKSLDWRSKLQTVWRRSRKTTGWCSELTKVDSPIGRGLTTYWLVDWLKKNKKRGKTGYLNKLSQ